MPDHPLNAWLSPRRSEMLSALRTLVEHESPSRDKAALDALALRLDERFHALGASVERIPNPLGGDHVLARFPAPGPAASRPPALLLGHFDTVWPVGTLSAMPFRIVDGRAHGPGTFDMKASIVLVDYAIQALHALDLPLARPVVALFTSDEEIGSPTSRALIEAQARGASHVLVLESPLPGGRLKTARKGVGSFTLRVHGRSAHAGIEPEKGASAVVELAHQVLRITALGDWEAGTTLNVGVVRGGTASNVVPAEATAQVDVRAWTLAEAARVESALRGLAPASPGTSLELAGGFHRPPMERTPATAALFDRARGLAQSLGLDLAEGSTGGGSDANFTAALGIPTLDGLGCEGAGAHAEHEHILVDSLPSRAALLALLLSGLA